jgi:hypothetical protein
VSACGGVCFCGFLILRQIFLGKYYAAGKQRQNASAKRMCVCFLFVKEVKPDLRNAIQAGRVVFVVCLKFYKEINT